MNDFSVIGITRTCHLCGTEKSFVLEESKYNAWRAGDLAQFVWPEMSDDDREMLISEICGKCFDNMFKGSGETDW